MRLRRKKLRHHSKNEGEGAREVRLREESDTRTVYLQEPQAETDRKKKSRRGYSRAQKLVNAKAVGDRKSTFGGGIRRNSIAIRGKEAVGRIRKGYRGQKLPRPKEVVSCSLKRREVSPSRSEREGA